MNGELEGGLPQISVATTT